MEVAILTGSMWFNKMISRTLVGCGGAGKSDRDLVIISRGEKSINYKPGLKLDIISIL